MNVCKLDRIAFLPYDIRLVLHTKVLDNWSAKVNEDDDGDDDGSMETRIPHSQLLQSKDNTFRSIP